MEPRPTAWKMGQAKSSWGPPQTSCIARKQGAAVGCPVNFKGTQQISKATILPFLTSTPRSLLAADETTVQRFNLCIRRRDSNQLADKQRGRGRHAVSPPIGGLSKRKTKPRFRQAVIPLAPSRGSTACRLSRPVLTSPTWESTMFRVGLGSLAASLGWALSPSRLRG